MSESETDIALEDLAEALQEASGRLSALDSLILAAVTLDFASDSRSLAKVFEVGHALVLRAIVAMAEAPALLDITRRDPRTQRCFLVLASAGAALVAAAAGMESDFRST